MTVERIGVFGAGAMGHGIAQAAAQAGYATWLCDLTPTLVDAGVARVRENLEKGVELGKVTPRDRDGALARITATTALDEVASVCELVVEAIPEDLEMKRAFFADIERHASPATLLATNTSSLSVAAIAEGLSHPERLVGMHFFNPVHVMKLIEIVTHPGTSKATLEAAVDVGTTMGKTPIVVQDSPGFATSRLGVVLGLEAMRMVEQGVASVEDIDTAMELGYRHPMGPLRLTDLVGLDVRLAIARYLFEELQSEAFRPPPILERLVAEGHLGKKSGRGFYQW